ncbi:unnamed protein product [Blepharisma stoltei]|uniref:Ubiquitin-like protein n=1 Tax=Blepharisma stoltei TaxID=1481888 RepID=A0AAU9JB74_9CILI|nr:unnamed protein product [Blepharisma stoltei]
MKITLEPGADTLDFPPCTIEIGPNNEVEHLLSLLTTRYNTLDPTTLVLYLGDHPLRESLTVIQAGIKDNEKISVKPKRTKCCVLL